MSSPLSVRDVKRARKRHVCDWCLIKIRAGDPYRRYAGVGEDGFVDLAFHPDCIEAYDRERDDEADGDPEGVSWGERHDRGKTYAETHGESFE